ncbi:MAG TPA: flagellar motor protein MotB [Opitutaceae bacterium]|nr:flagellar motor protein MotB [Opitutaceae bacterium]
MARKKAAAHHGGAWKVAYADFVTAMMALFMVLWISAQDQRILLATSKYFQNPFHSPLNASSGVMPFNSNRTTTSQGRDAGSEKEVPNDKAIKASFLNTVASDFYRLLHVDKDLAEKPIDIQITSDGLRVTLFDRGSRQIFETDSTEFTEWGEFVMQNLAWAIDRNSFRLTIDGHTRTREKPLRANYSGWELSADRANAARRSLVHYAVDPSLVERVTGYGDTRPLGGSPAESEGNERVTLSLTLDAKDRFKNSSTVEQAIPISSGSAASLEAGTPEASSPSPNSPPSNP